MSLSEPVKFGFLGTPASSASEIDLLAEERGFVWIAVDGADPAVEYDAVFAFAEEPNDIAAETVGDFIGHPHLRVISATTAEEERAALRREIDAVLSDTECERKFLIGYPDIAAMEASPFCASAQMVQTYLLSEPSVAERVRMRECRGEVVYTHTLKRRIDQQMCEEQEETVDREAYCRLLQRADPARKPIEKTRWYILHGGCYFELDIYPFWNDRAVVELELSESSAAAIDFPPYFRVIREVSDDMRYKNARLAKEVPYDTLESEADGSAMTKRR